MKNNISAHGASTRYTDDIAVNIVNTMVMWHRIGEKVFEASCSEVALIHWYPSSNTFLNDPVSPEGSLVFIVAHVI